MYHLVLKRILEKRGILDTLQFIVLIIIRQLIKIMLNRKIIQHEQ